MKADVKHPCEGMSKAERAAFDRIAAGAPPKSSTQTLSRLIEAGLVERHTTALAADRFGQIVRHEYSVPLAAHLNWCEWMTRPKTRVRRKALPKQEPVDELPLFGQPNAQAG
ncbi:hypothetical protein ACQR1W_12665 [Bradyrhizobium sp. HKCCYLS1011]|uniref:hypothetical protein n=1 Tax=Bradyrhizobium sp. HKCCYLS1011 TaxID=3420733 RepID=UPI003EC005A0